MQSCRAFFFCLNQLRLSISSLFLIKVVLCYVIIPKEILIISLAQLLPFCLPCKYAAHLSHFLFLPVCLKYADTTLKDCFLLLHILCLHKRPFELQQEECIANNTLTNDFPPFFYIPGSARLISCQVLEREGIIRNKWCLLLK